MTLPVFVLSAGRTGTVFLTRTLPRHCPELHTVHEPEGSRSNLALANLRNLVGLGSQPLAWRLRRDLDRRRAAVPANKVAVEVNPMLCPLTDLLPSLEGDLRVVHMVRHPETWVQSIRAFKASPRFRGIIDLVPLTTPYPVPRPPGWLRTDQVTRALHRWTYCNAQILAIEAQCVAYTLIRYEDLFGGPGPQRDDTLRRLVELLGVAMPDDPERLFEAGRVNPAPPGDRVQVDGEAMARICGPLMRRFGYEAPSRAREA